MSAINIDAFEGRSVTLEQRALASVRLWKWDHLAADVAASSLATFCSTSASSASKPSSVRSGVKVRVIASIRRPLGFTRALSQTITTCVASVIAKAWMNMVALVSSSSRIAALPVKSTASDESGTGGKP